MKISTLAAAAGLLTSSALSPALAASSGSSLSAIDTATYQGWLARQNRKAEIAETAKSAPSIPDVEPVSTTQAQGSGTSQADTKELQKVQVPGAPDKVVPTPDNTTDIPDQAGLQSADEQDGPDPFLIRLQILLDRANASPGVIDGFLGENTTKAIRS